MLINFGGENFYGFKDKISLNLLAKNKIKKNLDRTFTCDEGFFVLPINIIFSKDNQEKKRLIYGINYFKQLFLDANFFRKQHRVENPIRFFIQFVASEKKFYFEISYDKRAILYEKLSIDQKCIYERRGNELEIFFNSIDFNKEFQFKQNATFLKNQIYLMQSNLHPLELFLSNGFKHLISVKICREMMDFIEKKLIVFRTNQAFRYRDYDVRNPDLSMKTKRVVSSILESIKMGSTIFIDCLDQKIPYDILEQLILTYKDLEKNIFNAQLIFTSSNPFILRNELIRIDEIKVFADSQEGNRVLCDLYEIKNRMNLRTRCNRDIVHYFLKNEFNTMNIIDLENYLK